MAKVSNRLRQINMQKRFQDNVTWPPEPIKSYTPLVLIHREGHHIHTQEEVTAMAIMTSAGDIDKVTSGPGSADNHEIFRNISCTSKTTKEIGDILTLLEEGKEPCFILIEGAPGIGKSILLKEIAYRWGKKHLLHKFDLVLLLCLRNPSLCQIKNINDLLLLFYKGDKDTEDISSACSEYLSKNGGENLVLLLDGYDEYPDSMQEKGLITDILKREVLPNCGLIVSSRPHASKSFHRWAKIRVDILGFTETERQHFIEQALPNQPCKIQLLTQYLYRQPTVSSMCFIPFNMVILVFCTK